jgi:hypothetical protein
MLGFVITEYALEQSVEIHPAILRWMACPS